MKRVLIIDDAEFMRFSLKTVFEKNGFQVVAEAENGVMGVEKYKTHKPDLVTLDITMPEMRGTEALKLIREFDPKAKVVMVAAVGQEFCIEECLNLGAKSFVIKPFSEALIVEKMNQMLAL